MTFDGAGDFEADGPLGDRRGRNMHFGVREHAMCAAVNGMTLTGLRAFGSGFLIFTDYARGAIRLASLMDLPVLHIWTHDSISVGEDGPTHEPIEQMVSLRAIPGMIVIRPADANEMTEAYRLVLQLQDRPAALICSRQPLPIVDRTQFAPAAGLARGAYVLADAPDGTPDVILIASGSEVALCVAARERLVGRGHQGARRQHAVMGTVRGAGSGVSRQRVAAGSDGACYRRGRFAARLATLCRPGGRRSGDAHVRPVGADEGGGGAFRLHCRWRCRRGQAGHGGRPVIGLFAG